MTTNTVSLPAACPYTVERLKEHVLTKWDPNQLVRLKGLIEVELNERTMRAIGEAKKSQRMRRREQHG